MTDQTALQALMRDEEQARKLLRDLRELDEEAGEGQTLNPDGEPLYSLDLEFTPSEAPAIIEELEEMVDDGGG